MSRVRDWLISGGLLLAGRRGSPKLRPGDRERVVPEGEPDAHGELAAVVLLLLGGLCAIGFIVVYAVDAIPHQPQFLGLTLGLSLVLLAAALIVTAKRLIVTEELEDDYPVVEHREEQELIEQVVAESGGRLTRRRLFKLALGFAGGSLGLALITPAASLGPALEMDSFYRTPWRRGRRLVDEDGRPLRADAITTDEMVSAFPRGASRENVASPVVVVRLPVKELKLPDELAGYDADGVVAFSKICTHAACAISLYRTPLFEPTDPKRALVCPCHYSTFDPATGGEVIFGPAGRKLPMLPLMVDRRGELRAAGNFDGPVGASWWGVRLRSPRP
jgi:ubiquinol-cytochrome c reductase iron-sulfur subunit